MDKEFALEIIHDKISICKKCDLYRTITNYVPGEGPVNSKMIICGESAGQAEDESGRPFCGPSGQLLTRWLEAIKINRKDIFITNCVKCKPPRNRNPEPEELQACRWYLDQQIEIIQPKILLILGSVALKNISGDKDASIMAQRGHWFEYQDIPVMPMYHPSFVLRQMTDENKKRVNNDLVKLRDKYNQLT